MPGLRPQIPDLGKLGTLAPVPELDDTMLRHMLTFRARHIETLVSVVFTKQLRELGRHLRMRAHAMVRQFHASLLERSAFDPDTRPAVDKSQLFLSATNAAIVDVASMDAMERRFLAAFGKVAGDPERWKKLQQTVDYDKMTLDNLVEHLGVLTETVRDMKQINVALQIELQGALTNVFQYYLTNAGLLLEDGVVNSFEHIFRTTCLDLVNVVDKTFRVIKDVITSDEVISDHNPLEESTFNLVLSISDIDNIMDLLGTQELAR